MMREQVDERISINSIKMHEIENFGTPGGPQASTFALSEF